MLLGHQEVIRTLGIELPPVSIITGPSSVGKRLVATSVVIKQGVARVDFTEVSKLTVDEAIRVKSFIESTPMKDLKVILINLDNATSRAMDKLLLTLEEPPNYARFILTASQAIPRTLQTRAWRYQVGYLKSEDLLSILIKRNIPLRDAEKLSSLGQVNLALDTYNNVAEQVAAINILQAAQSGDYVLFMQACKSLNATVAKFIVLALQEAASQSWAVFNEDNLGAFSDKKVALHVLGVWSTVDQARPTLAVRSALESIMKG